jgi:actin-related protein 5
MAGVDSAGLGEVIQNVLARFSDSEKGRLVKVIPPPLFLLLTRLGTYHMPTQNVFLAGGPSQLPGLVPRLQATLRPILPPEMAINIGSAADVDADPWRGMARFAQTDEFESVGVSRAEYEEHGGERVHKWWGGNWN